MEVFVVLMNVQHKMVDDKVNGHENDHYNYIFIFGNFYFRPNFDIQIKTEIDLEQKIEQFRAAPIKKFR
ncbi:MAG: hypothetical protein L3J54_01285, partial [Draconibacterium sp.]|nr:hypothetical protein [Draconibacterium sp.]